MTNKNIQSLKKFIKFKNVIDMIPVDINNCPEKLCGKLVCGKKRQFSIDELSLIEERLLLLQLI